MAIIWAEETDQLMTIEGVRYRMDRHGVIHQTPPEVRQVYDIGYVRQRYDTIFSDQVRQMSFLRAGYIIGVLGCVPASVLDVGYGNGDFLRVMREFGVECCGYDVTGYPLPLHCRALGWEEIFGRAFDLVCFFDSLEHMPELEFLGALRTNYIAVTVPHCHYEGRGESWFARWKHRRPFEHLHHFSPIALEATLHGYGYRRIGFSQIEDVIRGGCGSFNTFTAVFDRR